MEEMNLLQKLKENGFRPKDLERLANSPKLLLEMRKQIREPFETDVFAAQQIMGKNFLGPLEVKKYFGISYEPKEMEKLMWVPFSKKTLEECKETHILFCGAKVTIEMLFRSPSLRENFNGGTPPWYETERQGFFKKEIVGTRWYLLKKEVEPEFLKRTWDDTRSLIETRKGVEIGPACVYAYGALLYFKSTGDKIFKNPLHKPNTNYSLYEEYSAVWSKSQAMEGVLTQNGMGELVTQSATGMPIRGMVKVWFNRQNQISFGKCEKDTKSNELSIILLRKPDDPED